MKRLLSVCFVLLYILVVAGCKGDEAKAKYVFYFIGDGMGGNQVNGTKMFLADLDSVIGEKPLNFASFPARNYATTYSVFNGVSCSAAAGTALATGEKTKNSRSGWTGIQQVLRQNDLMDG